jgi:hypothetical protein
VPEQVVKISRGVDKLLRGHQSEEQKAILDWITPIDYAPQQIDYFKRRQEGTGQWLLDSAEFQAWVKTSKQTLFCPSIPGVGKTISTSIVINTIWERFEHRSSIGVAYIYFNYRRHWDQRLDNIVSSLLRQLVQDQYPLPSKVKTLYFRHNDRGTRPSIDEMFVVLHDVVSIYPKVFIVLDALDECQTTHGCRAEFLSRIFGFQHKTGANLFATSRYNDEIVRMFQGVPHLEIRATDEDTEKYLSGRMRFLPSDIFDDDIRSMITREIIKAVNGM